MSLMTKTKKFKNSKKQQKISLRWTIVNKVVLLLIICFSVYYVACTNDLTVKGFVIQDLKLQVNNLEETNKKLELSVYNLKNTENIDERAQKMKMVKVEKIDYITIMPGGVAKK